MIPKLGNTVAISNVDIDAEIGDVAHCRLSCAAIFHDRHPQLPLYRRRIQRVGHMSRIDETERCPCDGCIDQIRTWEINRDKVFQNANAVLEATAAVSGTRLQGQVTDAGIIRIGNDMVVTQDAQSIVTDLDQTTERTGSDFRVAD